MAIQGYHIKYILMHCGLCDFSRWLNQEQHRRWAYQPNHLCPRCEMGYWAQAGVKWGKVS